MRLLISCTVFWGLLLSARAEDQGNDYRSIPERNVFGLKPSEPYVSPQPPTPEPSDNLLLTGVVEFDDVRQALFTVIQPGKPPASFKLREGEQNDWLEVKSVQVHNRTAKVVLKKPSHQLRNVGAELVLSME